MIIMCQAIQEKRNSDNQTDKIKKEQQAASATRANTRRRVVRREIPGQLSLNLLESMEAPIEQYSRTVRRTTRTLLRRVAQAQAVQMSSLRGEMGVIIPELLFALGVAGLLILGILSSDLMGWVSSTFHHLFTSSVVGTSHATVIGAGIFSPRRLAAIGSHHGHARHASHAHHMAAYVHHLTASTVPSISANATSLFNKISALAGGHLALILGTIIGLAVLPCAAKSLSGFVLSSGCDLSAGREGTVSMAITELVVTAGPILLVMAGLIYFVAPSIGTVV